ncbi:MAG: hypothetical protein KKG14_04060 [Alphaproteobacteria bacterium]|nr:hypothetical protein [Alphaproteobacteria bacterium]MBU2270014.1 hypothetical protein [Alphaproteobacteria bacterium]MBU2417857.1 hypothetical protein [Alphaproteobacteria bacterium]
MPRRVRAGETLSGLWSIVASSTVVEIAAGAGFDFQILDLEHGPWSFESLEHAVRACELGGCSAIVRLPDLTPSTFQRVLDLGCHGLIVPQVRSAADAERVVQYARYGPRGSRGYNPFTRSSRYGLRPEGEAGEPVDEALLGVIIENAEAYADLDRICSIDGIDLVYLGVYDMSMALGCDGNVTDPKVIAFVEDATARIKTFGKAVGVMARSPADIDRALALGARFIVCGVDSNVISAACRQLVGHVTSRVSNFPQRP